MLNNCTTEIQQETVDIEGNEITTILNRIKKQMEMLNFFTNC